MELWSGRIREFVRIAAAGGLAGPMMQALYNHRGLVVGQSELESWENSLKALGAVCKQLESRNIGVVLEYHLPLSNLRIDAILLGNNDAGIPTALIVELKQWSTVALANEDSENLLVGGAEHVHPAQQAQNYGSYLSDVHSAFVEGNLSARSCAYLHNLQAADAAALLDVRFAPLLAASPVFLAHDEGKFASWNDATVGTGGGKTALSLLGSGTFKPSRRLIDAVAETIAGDTQWTLLGEQQTAYNAILAAVKAAKRGKGKRAILVRGGPGTGKSVIAIQLLATCLELGYAAAHSTGGAAFTAALRSKFGPAEKLFIGNINLRDAATDALDLLLVDEGHRIRETSDTRFTPTRDRGRRSQMEELTNAAKVTVFLLDDNQSMRPDEIGSSKLVRDWTKKHGIPLLEYELAAQFRCGGCTEYVDWVDQLLGFGGLPVQPWGSSYQFDLVATADALEAAFIGDLEAGRTSRLVAGFCWKWSGVRDDGTLEDDVVIGTWRRPWNAKKKQGKVYTPKTDPYTRWADTPEGERQIGCIYSAQGFEFETVGVIWGEDLVWRTDRWVAQRSHSYDNPVKQQKVDTELLLRHAYRVLLTRGMKRTVLLCLGEETRQHIEEVLGAVQVQPALV